MSTIKGHIQYLVRYFLFSGSAVLLDILLYWALSGLRILEPFSANMLSSVLGACLAWFMSGRHLFQQYFITRSKFILWLIYTAAAILFYSYCIDVLIYLGVHYVLSKMITLAVSFIINSMVFKKIILTLRREDINA